MKKSITKTKKDLPQTPKSEHQKWSEKVAQGMVETLNKTIKAKQEKK